MDKDSDNENSKPVISDSSTNKGSFTSHINEGFRAGQKIAKISVITLVSIGVAELLMGYISGSVVATADGVDSMSDAMISFIVLIGLRFARRPADRTFPSSARPRTGPRQPSVPARCCDRRTGQEYAGVVLWRRAGRRCGWHSRD